MRKENESHHSFHSRPSIFFKYRSVPRHGAKNILPLIDRFIVLAAITSHMATHIPVKT
jgi:hypothetical protein